MSDLVAIGPWEFDHVFYDSGADVVYLSIGAPRPAYGEETPEGHILRYDLETDEFCGVTLIGIRQLFEEEGEPTVTLPHSEPIARKGLDRVLQPA